MSMSGVDLVCRVERVGGVSVLWTSGEVDLASWKPFALAVYRAACDCDNVIVDLGGIHHFDACGAHALSTVTHLRPRARLTVRNPSRTAAIVIAVAGLEDMLAGSTDACATSVEQQHGVTFQTS